MWMPLQDEEDGYVERHVDFSPDVVESMEESCGKLRRRDTPHHLKNKRIMDSGKEDDEEKVKAILALAQAKNEMVSAAPTMVGIKGSKVHKQMDVFEYRVKILQWKFQEKSVVK